MQEGRRLFIYKMNTQVQLIAYIDRFGQSSIKDFHDFLKEKLVDHFGGVHLLPFFFPYDGSDAGYDPIDHQQVDQRLGKWKDIHNLSKDFNVMSDMIVNHISSDSYQFKDVLQKGSQSTYFDMFLTKEKVFEQCTEAQLNQIVQIRDRAPFTTYQLETGESFEFWTTFTSKQIDIDVTSPNGKNYLKETIKKMADNGIKFVRFDAIGFAIKQANTSCFMLPETYVFIAELTKFANQLGLTVLLEVHAESTIQKKAAEYSDFVYDFALPPLVLHSFASGSFTRLKQWFYYRPNNCVNVLDTHDGIGVYDASSSNAVDCFLNDSEVERVKQYIHSNTNGNSRTASGTNSENLDEFHINSSFFDAMGRDNFSYLAARAIQLFFPGIPQVYYGGLLANENDMNLLHQTKQGRDVNRPYYSFSQITERLELPVVKQLLELIELRNNHPAFQGKVVLSKTDDHQLYLKCENGEDQVSLQIDMLASNMVISYNLKTAKKAIKTIQYGQTTEKTQSQFLANP